MLSLVAKKFITKIKKTQNIMYFKRLIIVIVFGVVVSILTYYAYFSYNLF
jgi:hypothetical protein